MHHNDWLAVTLSARARGLMSIEDAFKRRWLGQCVSVVGRETIVRRMKQCGRRAVNVRLYTSDAYTLRR